jgi:hypothetical protein
VRILVLALAILVALVIAAGFLAERLVRDQDLAGELIRRVEASTSGRLEIQGGLGFALFPRPHLTLEAARFRSPLDRLGTIEMVADQVELTVRPLALLLGDVAVDELLLIRPTARLSLTGDDAAGIGRPPVDRLPVIPVGGRVRVIGGTLTIDPAGEAAARTLRGVDLAASLEGEQGPVTAEGAFVLASERLTFAARLGRFSSDGTTTLQLDLAGAGEATGGFEAGFSGLVSTDRPLRWQGRLSASFETPGRVLAVLTGDGLEPPAWLHRAVRGEGRIVGAADRLEVTELVLTRGETTGRGRLSAIFGPAPSFDLELAVDRLEGDGQLGDLAALPAAAGRLPASLRGRLDLTVDRLLLGAGTLERARLTAALSAAGAIVVEQARATLPGGADFSFTGQVGRGADALTGELALVSERLRPLLAWRDLEPRDLPPDSLQRLALQAAVRLTPVSLRLDRIESRLDASTITGSAELRLGNRRRLLLALGIDRLNLDSYLPVAGPAAGWGALERLASRDLLVAARIDSLTRQGLRWTDVILEGRSGRGQVRVDRLEARGIGETSASLSGGLDVAAETAQAHATLSAERPALLLRRLGIEPPPSLSRLDPLGLSASLRRQRNQLAVELEGRLEQLAFEVTGTTRLPVDPDEADEGGGEVDYDLELTATHPDYPGLIETLALTVGAPGEPPAAKSLEFRGRLRGRLGQRAGVTGSLVLGATRATGEVGFEERAGRPLVHLNLSLAEPRRETLLPWLGLFGLQLDPSLLTGPIAGNWPRQRLALELLPELDLELELNAKGGLAGDGLEAVAERTGGRLRVPRFAFRPFGGRASGEALVELDRDPPFGALALTLEDLDSAALMAWLGLPEAITGRLDGYTEATALGLSAYDLVRGLTADAKITLRDAFLHGLPVPGEASAGETAAGLTDSEPVSVPQLALEFEVERGIARITAVRSEVEPPPLDLEGHVDLLIWATDLGVRLPGAAASFRVVGPLDRPQVVVLEPLPDDRRPEPAPALPE